MVMVIDGIAEVEPGTHSGDASGYLGLRVSGSYQSNARNILEDSRNIPECSRKEFKQEFQW